MCFVELRASPSAYSRVSGFSLLELLIALALGTLILAGLFPIYESLNQLRYREQAMATFSENTRFLSVFLSNKINQAGDWSCASQSPGALSKPVQGFDREAAKKKLGLTIKPGTELLQLRECVRLQGHRQYRPIQFFIARTHRETPRHHAIDALFYKVAHHPREELIAGMTQWQLSFGVRDRSQKNILAYHPASVIDHWQDVGAVNIRYQFTDADTGMRQAGVLYAGLQHQAKSKR